MSKAPMMLATIGAGSLASKTPTHEPEGKAEKAEDCVTKKEEGKRDMDDHKLESELKNIRFDPVARSSIERLKVYSIRRINEPKGVTSAQDAEEAARTREEIRSLLENGGIQGYVSANRVKRWNRKTSWVVQGWGFDDKKD